MIYSWGDVGRGKDMPAQGYARTDDILYVDISGDGQDEAVISLHSSGTAGNQGVLVYTADNTGPRLVGVVSGYKLSPKAEGDHLVIWEPMYAGWGCNACFSGWRETRYRLQANQLVLIETTEGAYPEARAPTVEQFYELLNRRQYPRAYAFLSPAFQAAHPYDDWSAGYQNTLSIQVHATNHPDGSVAVQLTAVDKTDDFPITQQYCGRWTLVWSAPDRQWLLDQAQIASVPEESPAC